MQKVLSHYDCLLISGYDDCGDNDSPLTACNRPGGLASDGRGASFRQIAQGPWVDRFERDMAAFFGLQGGVAVSSGTAVLEVRCARLGLERAMK